MFSFDADYGETCLKDSFIPFLFTLTLKKSKKRLITKILILDKWRGGGWIEINSQIKDIFKTTCLQNG